MASLGDLSLFEVVALLIVIMTACHLVLKLFPAGKIKDFSSKYVLITGCDTGFGKMAAISLDRLGFHVIATCFTSQGEKDVKKETSKNVTTFLLDVTKSEQVLDVYLKVTNMIPSGKGLWGVVNNAGIATVGPVDWISVERYKQSADVNLWGMVDVTKTFLPLVKKTRGRIVNNISIGGRACLPNASAYCISKFGAEAFSDALRREMYEFDVNVSIVEPGFFKTPMVNKENMKKTWSNVWNGLSKEKQEEYGQECYETYVENLLVGVVDTCSSPDVHKVIDAIIHALTSTKPKSRYVIGWDARLLWIWLSRLPTSWGDAILRLLAHKRAVPKSVLKQA